MDQGPKLITDLLLPQREGGYAKGYETRELILRQALHILIEEGYRAMSMRRVATACGMRLGNLTYHYPTREDLVRELLGAVISSYEVEFAAIVHAPGVPPEERMARLCGLIIDDIASKKTTRLFPELWALANHDAFVYERVHELYDRARAPLVEIIAELRPDLCEADWFDLALFISSSMEGLTIFAGYRRPYAARLPAVEAIGIRSFIDIVRSFVGSAAPVATA
jgi:AcrR family transcriptional regulator